MIMHIYMWFRHDFYDIKTKYIFPSVTFLSSFDVQKKRFRIFFNDKFYLFYLFFHTDALSAVF